MLPFLHSVSGWDSEANYYPTEIEDNPHTDKKTTYFPTSEEEVFKMKCL